MQQLPSTNLPTLNSTSPLNNPSQTSLSNHGPFSLISLRGKLPSDDDPPTIRPPRIDTPAQSAKREILSNIRSDWAWPPLPSTPPPMTRLTPSTQYRARDSDSDSPPPNSSPPSSKLPLVKSLLNPYKYDTPDSLGQSIQARRRKRHRRRQREMEWNQGLATFNQRRDAWAGARVFPPREDPAPRPPSPGFFPSSPTLPPSSPPSPSLSLSSSRSSSPPSSPPPLIPLPAPLLPPTHPIRASITPAAYPAIYSKIVVQGLAPTVPINLSDVVGALVHGWKEKGEWPPREGAGEATAGTATRRDPRGAGRGLGIDEKGDGRVLGKSSALAKKGVGRMRKALGLSPELGSRGGGDAG